MAFGRFVVTATVTIGEGTEAALGAYGSADWSNGTGATSKWAPLAAYTFHPGEVIYADDTAPGTTPTGPQVLYQAIGAASLRAFVDGQDNVGHAGLSN